MKLHNLELPIGKPKGLQNTPKIVLLTTLALILLTTIPLYYPLLSYPSFLLKSSLLSSSSSSPSSHLSYSSSSSSSSSHDVSVEDSIRFRTNAKCDLFTGEWIPNPKAPYYTNLTCWAIHDHQNCQKYGRPDMDFLKWRWKPDDCELPIFNPAQFLELNRGKSLAFVGDSVGRNQMQSLICLLSRVTYPEVLSDRNAKSSRVIYKNYNFTIANFWTPYLVKAEEADPEGPTYTGLFNLHLDEFDEEWTTQIEDFNYLILSAGYWFFRPSRFYENGKLVGCHFCQEKDVPDLRMYYGYRKSFRTAFRAINSLKNFKGITFLRTFSPSHFENGIWNKGGNCVRKKPFMSNETTLQGIDMELYMTQLEEFRTAEKEGMKRGLKFRLLDTTQAMLLRPDGHPSRYGHWPEENVTLYNDCVHWCLPGPVDTWNDLLLEMLRMEGVRSLDDKRFHLSDRKMGIR